MVEEEALDKYYELNKEVIEKESEYYIHEAEYRKQKLTMRDIPPYCNMKTKTEKDDNIRIDTHNLKIDLINEKKELELLKLDLRMLELQLSNA